LQTALKLMLKLLFLNNIVIIDIISNEHVLFCNTLVWQQYVMQLHYTLEVLPLGNLQCISE